MIIPRVVRTKERFADEALKIAQRLRHRNTLSQDAANLGRHHAASRALEQRQTQLALQLL